MVKLTLPFPPTVNTYWRSRIVHCRNKPDYVSVYTSEKGKKFKVDVVYHVMKQKCYNKRLPNRLETNVFLYPPTKAKIDIDNRMKALLDALGMDKGDGAKVYLDDSQIDILHIERKKVVKKGKTEVWIAPIKNREIFEEEGLKINNCPYCKSEDVILSTRVYCRDCLMSSPQNGNQEKTIKIWNGITIEKDCK